MKHEYEDLQTTGEILNYGYKEFEGKKQFLWFNTDDEDISIEISPSHLRKLAMRLIKLSYRVDSK